MEQMVDTDSPCFESLPVEIQQHIFRYCGTKTRLSLMLVCKGWAEKLRYFREDFQVYLHHCELREDLEPVSLLMNSTSRLHSLRLGLEIHAESTEVQTRCLAYLGREVQELVLDWDSKLLNDPDSLLFFPQLKKLTVKRLFCLRSYKLFPKTLEHVHVEALLINENLGYLYNIESLNLLTSDMFLWKKKLARFKMFNSHTTRVYTLDENLKDFFEMSSSDEITFKCNKNFLVAPTITLDDVSGIDFYGPPSTCFSYNKFHNLRSILIWTRNWNCINFHQAVLCAGVAELVLLNNTLASCMECFKSIIDSFLNVKKIVLYFNITNRHVKYIFFKLPNLIHLETAGHNLNHEIICHDQPEYSIGNLMQLESLILPHFVADNILIHWPFMPHLKKVQFGVLSDNHGLNYFTAKTPNLEYFEIGSGSRLSDTGIEIISKNWPNLRTLGLSSTASFNLSPIKRFCRNLRTLELDFRIDQLRFSSIDTFASFFDEIPTLREMKALGETKYRYLQERDE